MPRYSAATALRDHLKPFLRCLHGKKRGLFLALSRGLLRAGAGNLSEACRGAGGGRICRWVERASLLLRDLPWGTLLACHDRRMRQRQEEWKLIVHDTTALPKPWAEEMEGLSTVYDGCTGELVNGYTLCVSVGVGAGSWDLHPLRTTLINPKAKEYRSQNLCLQEHVRSILCAGIGFDLLHVYDRGFDDEKWFRYGDDEKTAWMVRLKENRNVLFRREEHSLASVAKTMLAERPAVRDGITYAKTDIGVTITHDAKGKEIESEVRMYALIIVKRPQYLAPMLLLLNGKVRDWREAVRAYLDYLDRFEVEHTIRLFKQTLHPAVVQLMTCERIQGLLHLQTILLDFLLREAEDGTDPFGRGLHEILQNDYLYPGETLQSSPYVTARALRERLRAETEHTFGQRWPASPVRSSQMPLFSPMLLDTV